MYIRGLPCWWISILIVIIMLVNFSVFVLLSLKENSHKVILSVPVFLTKPSIIKPFEQNWLRQKITVTSLPSVQRLMKSMEIENTEDIVINYSNFTTDLPLFDSVHDYELFMKSKINLDSLKPLTPEKLSGNINVVINGSFKMPYDCGYKSNMSYLQYQRRPNKQYHYLVPLIVPMASLFQHFMDGTMPKIVQAYDFIMRSGVKILLEEPYSHHRNIKNILQSLGIFDDKIVWHSRNDWNTVYSASFMVFTCVTPPLHPEIWRDIRYRLGVSEERQGQWQHGKVILYSRTAFSSGGRLVKNLSSVKEYLINRYGNDSVVVYNGDHSFHEAFELFRSAKLVIGPHGGGLYNIMFSPKDTVIVEFGPVMRGGRDIPDLSLAIFWRIAHLIGQTYWRMPIVVSNEYNDMDVSLQTLNSILEKTERQKRAKGQI